jgi:uncharacterized protein (DUF58 family)
MSQTNKMIIDTDLMKMLDRLSIVSRKLFSGAMKGKRRSVKRGNSVEFADYRDYQPGDDFRFIDWNIYARLDRLFLKTFVEEENIYIHILLDVSPSMSFGTPSKLDYGKKIASVLGYIGLVDLDMVALTVFSEGLNGLRPMRGKDRIFTIMNFLENMTVSKETEKSASLLMDSCFNRYAIRTPHQGVAIIISDFLVPQNIYEKALKSLLYKNFDVRVIQVLSNEELQPSLLGELKLQDSESGETKEVTITDRLMVGYQKRLTAFCRNLEDFCSKNNMSYIRVNTNHLFEDLILKEFRKEHILI